MAPKDLVLISLDTLRADVAYAGIFPAIERLRRSGTTFTQAISPAPLTPVSHATVLTGRQPAGHGVRHLFRERVDEAVPTLAEVLRGHGYSTGAVVASPGMNAWYGFSRGFDEYDDWIPPLADGRDALHVVDVELRGTAMKRAPLVTERALRWYESAPGPRFLFAHYFDSHWPYEPPEDVSSEVNNPYEGEVAYMDRSLGHLLDGLVDRGLDLDHAVVALFSDHGEDLGGWYPDDHAGDCGHPEERGHGALLFDVTQRVPLVVSAPGAAAAGAEVGTQVRLVDVMSTVLELLGVPPVPSDGRSLVPHLTGAPQPDLPAHCETFYREELADSDSRWNHLRPLAAVRRPDHKVVWEHGTDNVELYDLRADPGEKEPYRFHTPAEPVAPPVPEAID
ncbi:sulfatase [Saccharothrix australiensis]|uniref:Arylsulfatase A-like enzyme n=1 Tax=Saccharothrix australiensis TaxID=2072 RepID=A0A495VZK3_9PSEU|nr:sulfatase [Saccharothrix australiensis]RKT53815.1 arylsulfatase A-like enzyme [Saccharothrix australiensis]